jgi:Ca-activated chloride channel family protein
MFRQIAFALLCGFVTGRPAIPQQVAPSNPPPSPPEQQERPLITAEAREVIVPVTVVDEKGRYVSNLEARDFRILDEGKPQRITFFSHDQRQPIVVGFLVDLSNNSRIHWKNFADAITELIDTLLPGDDPRYSGYLIGYANEAEMLVNTTQEADKLATAVQRMKPGGAAAFYDALYMACTDRTLIKGEPYQPRRVVVVIGDGHNSSGLKGIDQMLELAKRNLITIFGMSTQAFGFDNPSSDDLERLATETGGHVEYPLNSLYKDVSGYLSHPTDAGNYVYEAGTGGYAAEIASGITNSVSGIAGDIATQYVIRYIPDFGDDPRQRVFRRIKVELPNLPGVKIRARDGYYPDLPPVVAPSR